MAEDNVSILNSHLNDKFIAVIPIPVCLRNINVSGNDYIREGAVDVNTVQFTMKRFTLPSINIPAITVKYDGQSLKVSSHVRTPYEPIVLTMNIDSKLSNYWFFKNWMDCMNRDKTSDKAETHESEYKNFDYSSDMRLIVMDEYENKLVNFDFTKAFPVSVSGIQYDYSNGLQITANITFEYSQYLMQPIDHDESLPDYELAESIVI